MEITSERTETDTTWANPDGTLTTESAVNPIRVRDISAKDGWDPTDYDLVATAGGFAPKASPVQVEFSAGGSGPAATLTKGSRQLGFDWSSALPKPTIDGSKATYALSSLINLVLTATDHGFEESLIFTKRPSVIDPAHLPLTANLDLKGLSAAPSAQAGGGIDFTRENGASVFRASAPVIFDASRDAEGLPTHQVQLSSSLSSGPAGPRIDLGGALKFLADPATVYPVTVDPVVTTVPRSGDTWYAQNDTTSHLYDTQLWVGYNGTVTRRSLVLFGTDTLQGKHILSASLKLWNNVAFTCAPKTIYAYRVSTTWPWSVVWSNRPTVDITSTYQGAASFTHGDEADGCANDYGSIDVTKMVAGWASGAIPNYGIELRAPETDALARKEFCSMNPDTNGPSSCTGSARFPTLSVTYNTVPSKPAAPTITTTPASATGYSVTTTPRLNAVVNDVDGNVHADFAIYQGTNTATTPLWTGSSAVAGNGSKVSVDVPVGKLVNAATYTVTARAADGTDASAYSSGTTFTVDTAPPATTVTATHYTAGAWDTSAPTSDTFTVNASADTSFLIYYLNGGAPRFLLPDGSHTASFTWTPSKGANTVTVIPYDKAGNSASSVFGFGTGPGDITHLIDHPVSTGTFPLQANAPSGATGTTVSWRFAGATDWTPVDAATLRLASNGSEWDGTPSTALVAGDSVPASETPQLTWNATDQTYTGSDGNELNLKAPALLDLQVCFIYSCGVTRCATENGVQLVPSAFGGDFPTTNLGPGTVALTTGELTLSQEDAVDTAAGVGRTFTSYDASTLSSAASSEPFGPGWSTTLQAPGDAPAKLIDHRQQDRTLVLVTAGDSTQVFKPVSDTAVVDNPTSPVVFKPAGLDDGSRLTLDPTNGEPTNASSGAWSATLVRPGEGGVGGETTTWTRALSGDTAGTWVFQASTARETDIDEPEVKLTTNAAGYPTWVAQSDPGEATTCSSAIQEPGCRGLRHVYGTFGTGSSAVQRVIRIDRIVADNTGVTTDTIASYTYSGPDALLATACGPDPDKTARTNGPLLPLCTSYGYDTTTVQGRTLLNKLTPPGEAAWSFHYDASNRVTSVSRPIDTQSTDATGTATWRVVYDLSPNAPGMPDISTATAARWGQTVLPVAAAGVYPPSAGDTTDVTKATLWLYDETGTITNTAIHGNVDPNGSGAGTWLVDTTWYDVHGNAARVLSAAGRQKALSSSPDPAQQAQAAELASKYNFYGDDGTRIEDEYEPAQTSVLRDGTPGLYRAHTSYIYDGAQDGPHSSASLGGPGKPAYSPDEDTFGLFVETRDSAADPQMLRDSPEAEHDVVVTRYSYDPVVDGDASGWTLGVPTRTKTQLQDGTWSVETARFNADGQQIETRSPGGSVDANGAGTDAHSSVTDYYSAGSSNPSCDISGHPERAQWDGLTCVVRPGGQPSNQPVAILHYQSYGADLQPLVVTETAGSTTRTTTTTYDAMDRVTKRVVSASGTGVDPDTRITSVTYASTTGLEVSSSDAGSTGVTTPSTITHSYDNWGRVMSYTDANGLVSSTQYTIDGGIASFDDGTGTGSYTYSYDDADGVQGEHRGLRTSVAVGLAAGTTGRFTIRYDADGRVGRLTYPDGLQANIGHTDSGATTSLEYAPSGASQPMIGFWNTVDVNGRVASSSSVASHQSYSYDNLGRLSEVRDWNELSADGGASEKCSVRRYGFTESSERSGADYFGPALDGSCQTDTAQASVSQTYDSAGRRIDTGYAYDSLGRTLTIPAADSNNSDPASDGEAATYYASDMIRTLTHAGPAKTVTTYGIDPDGRVTTVSTSVGGAETDRMLYQYSDSSDAPSRVLESNDGGASWSSTRYIEIPGMGAVATVADDSVQYLLSNIHGDIVAAQDPALGAGQVESYGEFDEYGNPIGQPGSQSRYGYLGVKQRSTDTPGRALVLMGARVYNPKTGAFLSVDPVAGANATPYGYPEDPVNDADVSGASPAPPPGDGATSAPEPGGSVRVTTREFGRAPRSSTERDSLMFRASIATTVGRQRCTTIAPSRLTNLAM